MTDKFKASADAARGRVSNYTSEQRRELGLRARKFMMNPQPLDPRSETLTRLHRLGLSVEAVRY